MKRLLLFVAAPSLSLACSSSGQSSLKGTMRLDLDGTGSLAVDGPPGKLRAQIDDDGKGCSLDMTIESDDGSLHLDVSTYADEVTDLVAGKAQDVAASSHADRSIAVNGATIYVTRGSDTWYSTAGTLHVAALPSPVSSLHVDVDATVENFTTHEEHALKGTIDASFIGAVRTGQGSACPRIPDVPKGTVL